MDQPRRGPDEPADRLARGYRLAVFTGVAVAVTASVASGTFALLHEQVAPGRLALVFLVLPVLAVVAGLIIDRRPTNTVGWVFLAVSALIGMEYAAGDHAIWALHRGVTSAGRWSATFSYVIGQFTWIVLHLGIALFPTGTFASRSWRRTFIGLWGTLAAAALLAALAPGHLPGLHGGSLPVDNLLGVGLVGGVGTSAASVVLMLGGVGLVFAAASLVTRFRRSDGSQRRQIALVVYAMLVYAAAEVVEKGAGLPANVLSGFAAVGVPIAVGVALLRHQLYGIEHLISRTISYGALTLLLAGLYVGAVIGVGQNLLGWSGTGPSDLLVASSTLGIAAAFGPLRRRIQRTVDRRFNRIRYDAALAMEALARQLRHEVDLEVGATMVTNAVRSTLHPVFAAVWITSPADARGPVGPRSRGRTHSG